MKVSETVRAIFSSYEYNREYSHMVELCEEVNKRVCKYRCNWTDDGNIIYGFLVMMYGDYGTSPRSGWFSNENQKSISECIYEMTEEYKRLKEENNES